MTTDRTDAPQQSPTPAPRWYNRPAVAALTMCVAVVAVYFPIPSDPGHNTQFGGDFQFIHARRMAFAREQFAEHKRLPAWYPRELMGTPFWANVQNFPFTPTRLVLHAVPPLWAYTVGVMLSAVLAALFTFLYARAIGLSPWAAAAAGWTFGCAGFYASRVVVGVLPLLEGYPALPLLLWLVEVNLRGAQARPWRRALALGGLALASLCVALAGHPQLPFYAFVVAGLYLFWRGWGRWRRFLQTGTAMGLGVACAAFVLVPMLLLIGRSTRVLPLEREANNIPLPFERLAAFVLPWKDGRLGSLEAPVARRFPQFPEDSYFFDAVNYIGLVPLASVLTLAGWAIVTRRRPSGIAVFLATVAAIALVTALPPFHGKAGDVSATFLRSPSRQTYVTAFALALALGAAVDVLRRGLAAWVARRDPTLPPRDAQRVAVVTVGVLVALHVIDLTRHDRAFVRTAYQPADRSKLAETKLRLAVGDGRVAIDTKLTAPFNRRIDDIGFFESVMLARPYATLLALHNAPPTYNLQMLDGSQLSARTLAAAGVKVVMTTRPRPDLKPAGRAGDVPLYEVPDAVPRASFLPASAAAFVPPDEMRARMRGGQYFPHARLMLSPQHAPAGTSATAPSTAPATGPAPAPVDYERPSGDEIVVTLQADGPGYLRVLESFDPGWRAELDGREADVLAADDTFLAVTIPSAGQHSVRFTYHTPGAKTGAVISLASLVLLGVFVVLASQVIPPQRPPEGA